MNLQGEKIKVPLDTLEARKKARVAILQRDLKDQVRKEQLAKQFGVSVEEIEDAEKSDDSLRHNKETADGKTSEEQHRSIEDNPSVVGKSSALASPSVVNTFKAQTSEPSRRRTPIKPTSEPSKPVKTVTTMTVLNPSPISQSVELLEKSLVDAQKEANADQIWKNLEERDLDLSHDEKIQAYEAELERLASIEEAAEQDKRHQLMSYITKNSKVKANTLKRLSMDELTRGENQGTFGYS